jgi:hypothetical protein
LKMVIFHSYVSLPEGNPITYQNGDLTQNGDFRNDHHRESIGP